MLAALIELIVNFGDVCVPTKRRRGMKAVAGGVQRIALGKVIGHRIRLEQLQDGGIGADVGRIELLDLIRRQLADAAVFARVLEKSIAKIIRGHNSQAGGLAAVAAAFVVEKVEEPVFFDRTASGRTEDIADQFIAGQAGQVIEKVVGAKRRVAIELIRRTVESVGATLRDERHLGAGTAAQVRAGVGGGRAELLDRIEGDTQNARKWCMVLLVVYVNAVQGDVGLVRFATINGSGTMIGTRRAVGPQAGGQL